MPSQWPARCRAAPPTGSTRPRSSSRSARARIFRNRDRPRAPRPSRIPPPRSRALAAATRSSSSSSSPCRGAAPPRPPSLERTIAELQRGRSASIRRTPRARVRPRDGAPLFRRASIRRRRSPGRSARTRRRGGANVGAAGGGRRRSSGELGGYSVPRSARNAVRPRSWRRGASPTLSSSYSGDSRLQALCARLGLASSRLDAPWVLGCCFAISRACRGASARRWRSRRRDLGRRWTVWERRRGLLRLRRVAVDGRTHGLRLRARLDLCAGAGRQGAARSSFRCSPRRRGVDHRPPAAPPLPVGEREHLRCDGRRVPRDRPADDAPCPTATLSALSIGALAGARHRALLRGPRAKRRVAVVFTDGETLPQRSPRFPYPSCATVCREGASSSATGVPTNRIYDEQGLPGPPGVRPRIPTLEGDVSTRPTHTTSALRSSGPGQAHRKAAAVKALCAGPGVRLTARQERARLAPAHAVRPARRARPRGVSCSPAGTRGSGSHASAVAASGALRKPAAAAPQPSDGSSEPRARVGQLQVRRAWSKCARPPPPDPRIANRARAPAATRPPAAPARGRAPSAASRRKPSEAVAESAFTRISPTPTLPERLVQLLLGRSPRLVSHRSPRSAAPAPRRSPRSDAPSS